MKKGLTELVFILDKSGSMADLTDDTIGGFNSMIAKQKEEDGECLVTTVLFANEAATVHDRVPLAKIEPMTRRDYCAAGCTALFDAVGSTVRHIETIHRYAREEDRPERTLFVITTDGMENASRQFSGAEVKSLVEKAKSEQGFEFLFLAANIDAAAGAQTIGIAQECVMPYIADKKETNRLYRRISKTVGAFRGGVAPEACFDMMREDKDD